MLVTSSRPRVHLQAGIVPLKIDGVIVTASACYVPEDMHANTVKRSHGSECLVGGIKGAGWRDKCNFGFLALVG